MQSGIMELGFITQLPRNYLVHSNYCWKPIIINNHIDFHLQRCLQKIQLPCLTRQFTFNNTEICGITTLDSTACSLPAL